MAKTNTGKDLETGKTFRFGCEDLCCGARFDIVPNPTSQRIITGKRFCPYCGSTVHEMDEKCLACFGELTLIDPETTKFCPACGSYLKLLNIF